MIGSLLAAAEERWLVSAYSSRHTQTWVSAYRWITFPLRLRRELWRYEATAAGRPLTVVTIGASKRLLPFCERLVGELNETSADRQVVWNPTAGNEVEADLVVAEIHRWFAPQYQRAGWHLVPSAVRWQGVVESIPPQPPSKSLRDDLRKVRQHRYELERGHTAADWDEFYTTMVMPHTERRFGDDAWVPSATFLRAIRRVGILHFVCRRGIRVGGFCMVPNGDALWCPLLGTLAGDETLRREGAMAAVYALGIDWAKAHGYRFVDKGRTSPFVNDGVAAYKRKWGLAPVADPLARMFALKLGSHPVVAEALAREPVWMVSDTGLLACDGAMAS